MVPRKALLFHSTLRMCWRKKGPALMVSPTPTDLEVARRVAFQGEPAGLSLQKSKFHVILSAVERFLLRRGKSTSTTLVPQHEGVTRLDDPRALQVLRVNPAQLLALSGVYDYESLGALEALHLAGQP